MPQPIAKSHNKESYQSWLVGFTIVFVVFVKFYMLWAHPSVQKDYQKPQHKIDTRSQVSWQYPNMQLPLIGK
jgi:quinol-cytochrome oxidoreductase complex cytochrome b subunit